MNLGRAGRRACLFAPAWGPHEAQLGPGRLWASARPMTPVPGVGPHTARPVVSPSPATVALAPLHVGWEPGVAGQPGALKAPQGWRSPAGTPNIVESSSVPSCPRGPRGVGAGARGGAPTWSLWPARAGAWSKQTCPARAARRSASPSRMCGLPQAVGFQSKQLGLHPAPRKISTQTAAWSQRPISALGPPRQVTPGMGLVQRPSTWSPDGSAGKEPACSAGAVQSLGPEDPLEEGPANHSSILAWRIPWTGEPWRATARGVTESRTRLSEPTRAGAQSVCKWPHLHWIFGLQPCHRGQPAARLGEGRDESHPGRPAHPGTVAATPQLSPHCELSARHSSLGLAGGVRQLSPTLCWALSRGSQDRQTDRQRATEPLPSGNFQCLRQGGDVKGQVQLHVTELLL